MPVALDTEEHLLGAEPHGAADTGGSGGRRPLAAPLAIGAVAAAGCLAVAATDPGDGGVPLCWSRSVFGVDCPFCGGLRATNSLLRLDGSAALDHNFVLAVGLPVAAMLWIWSVVRRWRGAPPLTAPPTWMLWAAGALLVAFGVVRNFGGPGWVRWMHSDLHAG